MNQPLPQGFREARRDRILQAARAVFLEGGYGAASMSMIAARLGGSKATLYAYFKSKEELFEAIVREHCGLMQAALSKAEPGAGVRETLTSLGLEIMGILMSDATIRTFRMVLEEAGRNPELARTFDQAGPQEGAARLGEYLAKAHERGLINTPDPVRAAKVCVSLMKGELFFRRLLNLAPEPDEGTIRREVEAAVDVFMAAYGTRDSQG